MVSTCQTLRVGCASFVLATINWVVSFIFFVPNSLPLGMTWVSLLVWRVRVGGKCTCEGQYHHEVGVVIHQLENTVQCSCCSWEKLHDCIHIISCTHSRERSCWLFFLLEADALSSTVNSWSCCSIVWLSLDIQMLICFLNCELQFRFCC